MSFGALYTKNKLGDLYSKDTTLSTFEYPVSRVPSPKFVISLINTERVKDGASPLVENTKLDESAAAKCDHMVANGYWAHVAPDGTQPWGFIIHAGYSYGSAAENLASGQTTPSDVLHGWMNSQSHKEAMLNPKYTEVGVASCRYKSSLVYSTLIVAHFAAPYVKP